MLTNLSNSVAINTSVLCDSLIWISKYLNQDQTITAQVAESGQLHAVILIVYTQNRQILHFFSFFNGRLYMITTPL